MKASIKFREDQKPLLRAKVPLNILGLPFQSGVVAGEAKELTLNLSTFFESGPVVKVAYRPNDAWNPFSFIVKTGTGPFGSPISSSMLMSAEFNLLSRGNPSFMLHFRPNFGDFSIKKSQSSPVFEKKARPQNGVVPDEDGSIEVVESPVAGGFSGKRLTVLPSESRAGDVISGLLSGVEVAARTEMPLRNRAVVNFRWGVRVPSEARGGVVAINPKVGISLQKLPFLVMNKISIEHVDGRDSKSKADKAGREMNTPRKADVADTFYTVKRELEFLQAENGMLKKAIEDLRAEFNAAAAGRPVSPVRGLDAARQQEVEKNVSKPRVDRRSGDKKPNGYGSKSTEAEVNEELKKAFIGASVS